MSSFVRYSDPRLGLKPARASPRDSMTRAAIRLLGDALAGARSALLAAPALGLPVRLIALHEQDVTNYLLNPRIVALAPLSPVSGETSPLTGPIRRNTLRARHLTMEGTDLSNTLKTVELADELAIQAQQAFALLRGQTPLDWMTPFHHMWLESSDPDRRAMFARVNARLHDIAGKGASGPDPTDSALAGWDQAITRIEIPRRGEPIAVEIDNMNPLRPVSPHARTMSELHGMMPSVRNVLHAQPETAGLMLATILAHPGSTGHILTDGDAVVGTEGDDLGLGRLLRTHASGMSDFRAPQKDMPPLNAIVVDQISAPGMAPIETDALRGMARALTGADGVLFWACPSATSELEDQLQEVFPALLALPVSGNSEAVIYVATKTVFEPDTVRARILSRATGPDTVEQWDLLSKPWLRLLKDGRRVAS